MKIKHNNIAYLLALVGLLIKLTSHAMFAWFHVEKVYYIGDAIAWPFVIGGLMMLVKGTKLFVVLEVFMWLSINNLIDERFGNPGEFELHEFIFLGAASLVGVYRYFKKSKSNG